MGVEGIGCLGVFVLVGTVVEIPFALGEHTVESPVEEDAEAAVGKVLARLQVLRCRCVAGCIVCSRILCASRKGGRSEQC